MTTTAPDTKADFRKRAFAARKGAFQAGPAAMAAAREHLIASGLIGDRALTISGYCPIRTEIDPTPLMQDLHDAGHRLCVPEITGQGIPLAFRHWWPGVAMADGPFGAPVPVDTDTLIPHVLIVPLLAFDRAGYRLGYGGGFYDRTLEGLRRVGAVTAIGYAFAAQEVDTVPTEPRDQKLDAIVTEREVIRP